MSNKLLVLAVTANAVIGQLLLKRALTAIGGRAAFDSTQKFLLSAATSPWVYASVAVQGLGYVLWMLLISREKIGVATASVAAGFYILVALSAWLIYDEALTPLQWAGIALIGLGVVCISLRTVA